MTKQIRREIAYLKSQDALMNNHLWDSLISLLYILADRIDQLQNEKGHLNIEVEKIDYLELIK